MTARGHAAYERALARAMVAPDPVAALRAAARSRALPRALRAAFAAADEDGVRIAALLVARLRFERLLRGSPDADAWFARDPASFTEVFRRYHHAVPPRDFFPAAEARRFAAWLSYGKVRAS